MLHGSGLQAGADFGQQRLARFAFGTINTHLDQFVRLEAAVDLGEDGVTQAVLADAGDGVQGMSAGAQDAAPG